MGPVFRAYEPDRDRLVAIKVFRLDLAPERVHQLVAEFERLIAAGLAHPGIAAPLATGIDGVVAYLAQEYVAADSLDIVIRNGPRPPADALRVVSQLADSLDFAAAVNITHGALHPRDVLISQDEIRLTGLGVARALERVGVTPPVRRPCTAPERIAGADWDRRADIFSLAALMHEMLWGRRISGTGGQAADALTELAGGDLTALRRVFTRALADEPAERFGTALAFAEALKEAVPGASVAAPGRASRQSAARGRRAVEEPRLPLDDDLAQVLLPAGPEEAARSAPPVAQLLRPVDGDGAVRSAPQLLKPAGVAEARFQDLDLATALVSSPIEASAIAPPALARAPAGLMEPSQSQYQSQSVAREHSRSEIWPLALALVVGLGLGFGGGYAVGMRDRSGGEVRLKPDATTEKATTEKAATEKATTEEVRLPPPRLALRRATPKQSEGGKPDTTTRSATTEPSPAAPGRLLIRSTPAGARVFVDGRERGETPATVRDLERGTHLVRLVRDGYATRDRRVVITASRPAQSLTIALARVRPPTLRNTQGRSEQGRAPLPSAPAKQATIGGGAGPLTVESRPSGASVFIDGKLVGTTPLNLSTVPAGDHTVWLERDGYRRWTSSVRVASGQNKVTASLER